MDILKEGLFTGERALYNLKDTEIFDSTFEDGESPLKESKNIKLHNVIFKWKYPMWYSKDIYVENSYLLETARSGIWYTENITLVKTMIEAPKQFRRSKNITLIDCQIPNAEETLWNCENIKMTNVSAKGNYLGLNSKNIEIENFQLNGNYAFDGASNIHIKNATMLSKDSFWNCENVVVEDSTIIGEYLGWNSKNLTFINCTIDSEQGMCYMDNIKMINCKLLNTNLAFELCTNIDAKIISHIDSIKNPLSGSIEANSIGEIIQDNMNFRGTVIDNSKTKIKGGE
jgi:hypothetical protein